MQIFLGGTCGNNHWREDVVIPGLLEQGVAPERIFNPVVTHWNKAAQAREDAVKQAPDSLLLFVIASPEPGTLTANVSAYSLIEAVMSLYDAPERSVVVVDLAWMPTHTAKALSKGVQDLQARFPHAPIFLEYDDAIDWLVAHVPPVEQAPTHQEGDERARTH